MTDRQYIKETKQFNRLLINEIEALAAIAQSFPEEEDGSEAQIEAENRLYERVEQLIPEWLYQDIESYALKATAPERIEHNREVTVAYLKGQIRSQNQHTRTRRHS